MNLYKNDLFIFNNTYKTYLITRNYLNNIYDNKPLLIEANLVILGYYSYYNITTTINQNNNSNCVLFKEELINLLELRKLKKAKSNEIVLLIYLRCNNYEKVKY